MNTRNEFGEGDRDSRKSLFAVSLAIHVLLLGVFPLLIAKFGGQEPEPIEIVFYPPADERPSLPVPPPAPEVEPEPVRVEPEVVKAAPPAPRPSPQPKPPRRAPAPAEPRVARVELPVEPEPVAPPSKPRPRPEVRTNMFTDAAPATVAARAPVRTTRAAGFDDTEPAPVPAPVRPSQRAGTRVGGFEVEVEQEVATPAVKRPTRALAASGFGGQPASAAPAMHAKSGSVSVGGFGADAADAAPRRKRKKPVANPDTPVEILSKPKPAYTEEARRLKVQGEVVLNVVFVASGEMRVLGVVEGLGHGLDETAIAAARKIEFKPARRDGRPVDHAATLRIVFQLA